MHTGDTVTDSLGRTWQVGQPLGRGLWGGSWVLRGDNDAERVVKVAHARTDFATNRPTCLRELRIHFFRDWKTAC
jgi:hypothetical protein